MQIPKLTCFDVGARNGLIDLQPLSEHISLYSFEPAIEDKDILNKTIRGRYADFQLIDKALYSNSGAYNFYLMANPSMNSMLQPDVEILDEYFDGIKSFKKWRKQLKIIDQKTISTTTIDTVAAERNIKTIDYLKIDTQGTELAVLTGAESSLKNRKIIVIKTEFAFIPLYKGQPTFTEIDAYLKALGYKLVTCEFRYGIDSPFAKNSEKPKWGIGGDAFYCLDFHGSDNHEQMLRAGSVLAGLGFLSNAAHLFKKISLPESEQKAFFKKIRIRSKKAYLKYLLPPFLVDWYKGLK